MEIKTLQTEIVFTEMISERNRMILQLSEQVEAGKRQITELQSKIIEMEVHNEH